MSMSAGYNIYIYK